MTKEKKGQNMMKKEKSYGREIIQMALKEKENNTMKTGN